MAEALVDGIGVGVDVRHAAHGARRDRRAVVGVPARDDDAPVGLALERPVMADEADRRVVRFGARRAVEHLLQVRGRDLGELAREGDDGGMRRLEEGVVERQLEHLLIGRLGQLLAAVADVAGPEPRHAVEHALALAVPDVGTVGAHDDAGPARTHRLVIGEGVQMVERVELLQLLGLVCVRHGKYPPARSWPKGVPRGRSISAGSSSGAKSRRARKVARGAPWGKARAEPRPRRQGRQGRPTLPNLSDLLRSRFPSASTPRTRALQRRREEGMATAKSLLATV